MNNQELKEKCSIICEKWDKLSEMVKEIESDESDFDTDGFTEAVRETNKLFLAINHLSSIPLHSYYELDVSDISYLAFRISRYMAFADDLYNSYSNVSVFILELLLDRLMIGVDNLNDDDPENGLLKSTGDFCDSTTGEPINWTYDVEKGNLKSIIKALEPDFEE